MPLALIVVTTVFAHAAFNGSRLAVSLNALALDASALTVGVLMSLYAALPMMLSMASGRLVDRIGVRRPILLSVAFLAISVALPGIAPGILALHLAAAGAGMGFMLFHIGVQHAVGEMSPAAERKDNFGWLALGFSISNFVGPTFAGISIDTLGFRVTFCLLALFAVSSLALLAWRRKSLPHTPQREHDGTVRNTWDLMRNPALRRLFIVSGLLASAWDLFVFVMPIYGTSIGLNASTIGLILGSFALATFLVRLALPWLSRRVREWPLITTTFAIAALAYALFPLVEAVTLLAAIAFLLGLGLGATQPSIMSLLYLSAPPGRAGEAVGIRSVVLNASHTVLPLAFGAVGAALGMMPVFWSMAGALAAGGWFANRRRRAEAAG